MSDNFPTSYSDVNAWSKRMNVSGPEARYRFAQYATLCGISYATTLRSQIVFKGGNALDFVLQPNRSTTDLDFSFDMPLESGLAHPDRLREVLEPGLQTAATMLDMQLQCTAVRQRPPGEGRTFVTFAARVGYALPDQDRLLIRMAAGEVSPQFVPVEISVNEPIVGSTWRSIGDGSTNLRIATLEDIVGEKLRALLQQPIRNRTRRQDILDIAVVLRHGTSLDRTVVAEALLVKAKARDVPVSRAAFRHPEIRDRARQDYDALADTTRFTFIPFDEAFAAVLALVDSLLIPES